ncbi:hypothetical protein LX32DRAFT_646537 [Colletotrichum zoysiae]|uniref:Uncharacterized protein n=1 Tax=Colletotrichum zoysiae TaxID=1216348 RepID=A0AAD9LWY5_9PEZI|nr:hypothetical protein LX32DRAFT_646537 [Colletotrichum zoysiae]
MITAWFKSPSPLSFIMYRFTDTPVPAAHDSAQSSSSARRRRTNHHPPARLPARTSFTVAGLNRLTNKEREREELGSFVVLFVNFLSFARDITLGGARVSDLDASFATLFPGPW